jgi:hypothetical protein
LRLATEFQESCGLSCELCEADGYDYDVLEYLNIPVVFMIDRSTELLDFLMKQEKDSKDMQAYRRRYLNNLRFAVVSVIDKAFAQFVDEKFGELGGKRIALLDVKNFDWSIIKRFD